MDPVQKVIILSLALALLTKFHLDSRDRQKTDKRKRKVFGRGNTFFFFNLLQFRFMMHYVNIRDRDSNYLSFKLTNKLNIFISVELENVFCNYLVTLIKIPSAPEGGSANTVSVCFGFMN